MSDCTACQQQPPVVPMEIDNRPGLSAIAYRIGSFPSFRAALFDAIHLTPELAGLGTRQSDDYSITLMELWSAVADILTFYQERIANEAYLRTATQRDSVLRLVRLIDYQLQPGLATTTLLSFTLEKAAKVTIPVGLRVQSVPAGTAPPQKFETIESITADARLNSLAIFPAPESVTPLSPGRSSEIVAPGADLAAFAATIAPGDQLVAYTSTIEFLKVASVAAVGDRIRLQWTIPPSMDLSAAGNGLSTQNGLFKVGRTFRLFGQDAPATFVAMTLADSTNPTTIRGSLASLDSLGMDSANGISLNGVYPGLKPGAQILINVALSDGTQSWSFAVVQTASDGSAKRTATLQGGGGSSATSPITGTATNLTALTSQGTSFKVTAPMAGAAIYELIGPQLRLESLAFPNWLSEPNIYLPGRRNGWASVEVNRAIVKGVIQPGITVSVTDLPAGREIIVVDADPTTAMSAKVIATEIVGDNLQLSQAGTDTVTVQKLGLDPALAQPITALASPPFDTVTFHNARLQIEVLIGQAPPQAVTMGPPVTVGAGWNVSTVAASLQKAIRAALPDAPAFAQAQVYNSADIAGGPASLVIVPGVPGQAATINPTSADPDTIVDLGLDATNVRYLDGVLTGPLDLTTAVPGTLTAQASLLPPAIVSFAISSNGIHTANALATGIATGLSTDKPLIVYLAAANRLLALPAVVRFERPAFLHLTLAPDGPLGLDATTAVLLGNVAHASQGETVANEIVGDGNASIPFQTFSLRRKPVTFLPGDGPHGAQSTLTVEVDGVEWTQVATLYGASPTDEVYVTRVADDTTLTMEFGDGVTGARATTGRANIVANYRTGIGLAGRVGANTLTTLLDIPNGLKRATNPLPADGGADPQTLADARSNAPSTVRTFGRAVSLQDFQDIVLAGGEIAKASATWVWTGYQKTIFLTVAAQEGGKLSADSLRQYWDSLLSQRDPNHPLLIDNYVRVPIIVTASINVDPRFSNSAVQQAALNALLAVLSFDNLQFSQPIYLSHIYAVLQEVDGVVSVDVADLNFKNQDPGFRKAHGADSSKPQTQLFMLPAQPGTAPRTVLPAELAWVEIASEDILISASGGRVD